ncbi:MAG: RnfH family protein [Arenicellales bacterium]
MHVEVVYGLPETQTLIELEVESSCTAGEAITQSAILDQIEGLELAICEIGIFGAKCDLDTPLRVHDRIEIYRPLLLSPTEARRLRAETAATKDANK